MPGYLQRQFAGTLTPERREGLARVFQDADPDCSGYLAVTELQACLGRQIAGIFPLSAAKMLSRTVSSQGQVGFEHFALLSAFVDRCVELFSEHAGSNGAVTAEALGSCLRGIQLAVSQETLQAITLCFDRTRAGVLTLPAYLEACALCLLSRTVFAIMDSQERGEILIGLEQVLRLALWFL